MGRSILSTKIDKILMLVSILSQYDFFNVIMNDGTDFKCTEIMVDDSGCLEFKRMFATPLYSDQIVDVHAISTKEYVCKSDKREYTIVPINNKPINLPIRSEKNWKSIVDLLDPSLFGDRFTTYIKELDILVLVVDPYLLGELTIKERLQIQHIIDVELHGLSRSMQMCRTVCFQVKIHDGRHRIYAGMYDLEHNQSVTSKMIYDERKKEVPKALHKAATKVISYAESVFETLG